MPKFSAFTPFGMLAFSGQPSRAEQIHRSIKASHGADVVTEDPEGALPARWYAWAMAIARASYTLERAGNQADPRRVTEMLPVMEAAFGVTPGYNDTIEQRRAVLASRHLLATGNIQQSVLVALQTALGSDFVAWRPTPQSEATSYPPPSAAYGSFKQDARIKVVTTLSSVAFNNTPVWVRYRHRSGDSSPLQAGEVIVIDPGRVGQSERVTITEAAETRFLATFVRAHEAGALMTTASHPFWFNTLRHSLVVVKNGRALNPEVRRKVHETLNLFLQGSASWDIVEENSAPGSAGPFRINQSGIGIVPLGTISL
jgi:hypothetical protein